MFLSELTLNSRHRGTYRLLADIYAQHRFVMSAFPDEGDADNEEGARSRDGVLYRIDAMADGRLKALVQSSVEPDWSRTGARHPGVICQERQARDRREFCAGETYRFRLRANPTICRVNRDEAGLPHPKREGVFTETGQLEWLARAAERNGFAVDTEAVLVTPLGKREGFKPSDRPGGRHQAITAYAVDFDGKLTVREPDQFAHAVRDGIGRAKAWGCGLLSVIATAR
ncbi:MAG TPA: type I-E CRISPR-associated protein Cas6/Cse3/CasE [Chthonomonadaceae bacterium]|nr:type I-E CRISPR-associated protein Cas6/Cse3/CasE [Chthonomonadaceae bacterium]